MKHQPGNIQNLKKEIASLTDQIQVHMCRSYFLNYEEMKAQKVVFALLIKQRNRLIKQVNEISEYEHQTHNWPDNTIDG
jgi:hypothetical protein